MSQQRTLILKREALAELSSNDLAGVGAAAAEDTWSWRVCTSLPVRSCIIVCVPTVTCVDCTAASAGCAG